MRPLPVRNSPTTYASSAPVRNSPTTYASSIPVRNFPTTQYASSTPVRNFPITQYASSIPVRNKSNHLYMHPLSVRNSPTVVGATIWEFPAFFHNNYIKLILGISLISIHNGNLPTITPQHHILENRIECDNNTKSIILQEYCIMLFCSNQFHLHATVNNNSYCWQLLLTVACIHCMWKGLEQKNIIHRQTNQEPLYEKIQESMQYTQ